MKPPYTLAICMIFSSTVRGEAEASVPVYVSAQQVKTHWVRILPMPHPLDRDYHAQMRARNAFMAKMRSGDYDLNAEHVAATHNRLLAIRARDFEAAALFEVELKRISETIQAEKKLAQEKKIAEQQQRLLLRIESQLLDSNHTMPSPLVN